VLRRRGADIPRFMDAAAPGLLVAQAIGRVGNHFNQELFGKPTGLPWGLGIDPSHRPSAYEHFATFHPTFLYELTWNLAGALVWLGHHRRIRPPGLFALYVAGYSGFRIIEELLRVDPALHILGLRLNFLVAALLRRRPALVRLHPRRAPRRPTSLLRHTSGRARRRVADLRAHPLRTRTDRARERDGQPTCVACERTAMGAEAILQPLTAGRLAGCRRPGNPGRSR
jgi:hypothetical protein